MRRIHVEGLEDDFLQQLILLVLLKIQFVLEMIQIDFRINPRWVYSVSIDTEYDSQLTKSCRYDS